MRSRSTPPPPFSAYFSKTNVTWVYDPCVAQVYCEAVSAANALKLFFGRTSSSSSSSSPPSSCLLRMLYNSSLAAPSSSSSRKSAACAWVRIVSIHAHTKLLCLFPAFSDVGMHAFLNKCVCA
jgi:hypothetical protein